MTDTPLVEVQLTTEFQRKLRTLAKKYRQIKVDLQPILEQLQIGSFLEDQIPGIGSTVIKVRIRNSGGNLYTKAYSTTFYRISLLCYRQFPRTLLYKHS
ncbi:MAG: hypothetical protein F6K31_08600 [Symploca sp. SIO2G7]|nr:hypothetical protein [Symploca sp. SIO2G7]